MPQHRSFHNKYTALFILIFILSGITLSSDHWYAAPCPGPWVWASVMTNSFSDPSTISMLSSWFYLVCLIWYYYFYVKFVMWIVKQKIENKRNLLKNTAIFMVAEKCLAIVWPCQQKVNCKKWAIHVHSVHFSMNRDTSKYYFFFLPKYVPPADTAQVL